MTDATTRPNAQAAPRTVRTPVLDIAYHERGPEGGHPVVLLHGFPDSPRGWGAVAEALAADGCRTLAPYLRGFGPTRFLSDRTTRSAQLGALAQDALDFADGLGLARFTLVGHDWGGRAAQAVAATHPERVAGLVSLGGYAITWEEPDGPPSYPALRALWYQYLLNMPEGRFVLEGDRRGFCRALWETWSPSWSFTEEDFDGTAAAFDSPDFVDIVVNAYRRVDEPADPRHDEVERALSRGPTVEVPTIVVNGMEDGVELFAPEPPALDGRFAGGYERVALSGVGHFAHRERPEAVVEVVRRLLAGTSVLDNADPALGANGG